jgi:sugar transferase (PEP-CTERM/EpsH1 system associated)
MGFIIVIVHRPPSIVRLSMKLLFLTPQLPYPPQKGTALRNFHLLRGASARHEVHLLSFAEPEQDPSAPVPGCASVAALPAPRRGRGRRLHDLLRTRAPDMAQRLASPAFAAALDRVLTRERFDLAQVEGIELARYLPRLRAAGPRLIFDDHNAEYLLQQRAFATDLRRPPRWPYALYSLVQWRRLRRFEHWACAQADRVLAVSEADRRAIIALGAGRPVDLVPNGIEPEAYARWAESRPAAPAPRLVFTGTMDYRPNVDAAVWFCRAVWPRVRAAAPDAALWLVGQRPAPAIRRLGALPGVTVTAMVEEIGPYLRDAAVYVAPLRVGGGTRFKLLEAMAAGCPIVSTRLGVEGIDAIDGQHLFLADLPEAFAARVLALLRAPDEGRRLAAAARAFVEERFDWRRIWPLWEEAVAASAPLAAGFRA